MTCNWASFAVLRVTLAVGGARFETLLDVGVDSDCPVCSTLPERGREREVRIKSPVDDRRDAETKKEKYRYWEAKKVDRVHLILYFLICNYFIISAPRHT